MSLSVALGLFLASGSPIDLDGTFFVQLGIFLVTFLILRSLVFRPILDMLDAREAAIDGAQREAHQMEAQAEEKHQAFEEELHKVHQAAGEERRKLRDQAQRSAREITERERQSSDAHAREARAKLQAEAARVRAESKDLAPQLASQLASKLLGREIRS